MQHLPFDKPGHFWKGNLHTHCTQSDGRLTTEQVRQKYQEAGYDFVAITNHFTQRYNYPITAVRHLCTDDFTMLTGAELHVPTTEMGEVWHIVAVGLPMDFVPPLKTETGVETGPEIAKRAVAAGAYVTIAHPNRCVMTEGDAHTLGPVHAIEIYNGGSHDENDRADSWAYLDVLTGRGKRYFAQASDDFHGLPYRNDFGMGWVHVKSESLAPDALLTALKAGHFYASTGPEIHDITVIPGEKISIKCSPANSIFVAGNRARAQRIHGDGITEAEFNLSSFPSPYCRVTVRTDDGKRAWSNPIELQEGWFKA
ncbi:MAG: CehA/McbA family metallohydrolase [Chloroflexota bacterium]